MADDTMQQRDPKDDELARRLKAYADARLSPSLSATSRMRAHVMDAAHRRAALAQADRDRAAAETASPVFLSDRTRRSPWRRSFTLLLAAGLTLAVGVGSAAASQAGGPLYPVRIWSETLTLPSEADARAQAELKRLENRLAEAAAATATGDTNAASAALQAYEAIVDEATDDVGNDVSAAATLDAGVRNNIDVLTVLVVRQAGHGQAGEAIQRALERAIDRSDSALEKLHGKPEGTPGNGPDNNPGNGPGNNPGSGPDATDRPTKTPNPNKPTDNPAAKTPKPRPTPKPDNPNSNSEATPKADHTPRAGPPEEPPGAGNGGGSGNGRGIRNGGGNGNVRGGQDD